MYLFSHDSCASTSLNSEAHKGDVICVASFYQTPCSPLEKKKKIIYTVTLESIHPSLQPQISLKTPQTLKLLRSTGTKGKEKRKSHHIKQVAQPRHHNDQEN